MKPSVGTFAAAVTVVGALAGALELRAQGGLDPRIAAYDRGPATIDVSRYPKDMQSRYKLFAARCSKCHTLARAINAEFALEDEWERYVKRMMRKPGSGIDASDAKAIFEFLVYDSKTRKKALYERKLKEAGRIGGP
ncbi:MAG TPA: photosystem P840 reaction-center cytochrome c-551 [Vicinamibacterales bacterium]|nr:photosystem P840 reaction-center cytochrome c-551 [Vicinamibacterales bacterium]